MTTDRRGWAEAAAARGAPSPETEILANERLLQRLGWLIAIRLVVITSVLLPYFFIQVTTERPTSAFDFFYLLAGWTYGASLLYLALLRLLWRRPALQAYIQFAGDLLLITGLIYYFGGPASPFSILYLVVIMVASILLRARAGVTVATAAWVLYAITSLAMYLGLIVSPLLGPDTSYSIWRLSYNLAVHFFGFYAVALMTSRLAQTATRAERELREKREDLADLQVAHRDVIQSIPSGLITTDRNDRITSINRAGQKILGKSEAELLGEPIGAIGLFSAEQWQREAANHAEAGARREVEYRLGGRVLQIGFSLSSLTNIDGAPRGRILIFQDLSHWRKLQEELQLKDRMAAVGELAAGIAHEIGNPLAAISGSVQMLSGSFDSESSQKKLLDIIYKESIRLDRTIKGFLKFARPKERSSVRFDIASLLTENMELLRNSPEVSPGHQLLLDVAPPSVTIVADPDQVSQIFWNLARNALRAMPDGGTFRVEGTLAGASYRIAFIDTGRGMSEEERAHLFHPFRSSFDGGTGIGMAIVYQIVQEHGGRLLLESREGHGSEIVVELPAGEHRSAASPAEA